LPAIKQQKGKQNVAIFKYVLVVRARRPGHITAVFPKAEVFIKPERDYLYRAFIERDLVGSALYQSVMDINYGNFKNSITDDKHHCAAMQVWSVMSHTQETPPYSGDYSWSDDLFTEPKTSSKKRRPHAISLANRDALAKKAKK
jgi:hypothetical protein